MSSVNQLPTEREADFVTLLPCRYKDAKAIVTIGEGNFYGYGFDIDVVKSDKDFPAVMGELQRLLCRLMTFPLVTVAAINGDFVSNTVHTELDRVMRVP